MSATGHRAAQPRVPATWADITYRAVAPLVFGAVHVAARVSGALHADLRQRTGHLPAVTGPLLWFHGASAGEMTAAAHLVHVLRDAGFQFNAGYTTTNAAGIAVARARAVSPDTVSLVPWDTPAWVARAMDRWQPRALFLVETELWPQLVQTAYRQGVPVLCVSARIYPRDAWRYGLARPLIAPLLRRLTLIATRNEDERERFLQLGADAARCVGVGDLKHTAPSPEPNAAARVRVALGIGPRERVIVCGSIHRDEVEMVMNALLPHATADVRIVVAPRHLDAGERVVAAARAAGLPTQRRSDPTQDRNWRLLLLDTHGELAALYQIATIAVVGGGFGHHGGHNLSEPVRAGAAVLFGNNVEHVADDAARLRQRVPDACVADAAALAATLRTWLENEPLRERVHREQLAALPDRSGIANGYVAVLSPWLREIGLEPA